MSRERHVAKVPPRHRRAHFDFSRVPTHWNGGDAFTSRFLDALSINFPEGERFFIESVLAFEEAVDDPALRDEMRLFARQEGQHGAAHTLYNKLLRGQNVKVERILAELAAHKRVTQRDLSPKLQLALTAAAEHLTATLAEGLLGENALVDANCDPEMRALYLWHAVEEVEHKAVAFDVYQRYAGGDYWLRVRAMLMITAYLHLRVAAIMRHMFEVDGVRGKRGLVRQGLWRMYGPRGYLTKLLPRYLAWFKPSFHPWQTGIPEEVKTWISEYEKDQDPRRATEAVFAAA
ncbi:MAG TPA: metal-dependent hydrolase [Polyangiales bacterium]